MAADELSSAPRPVPRWLQVAGLLVLVAGVTLLARGGGTDPPAPPTPVPTGTTAPTASPAPRAALRVGERCAPTVTATDLTVRFTVVNGVDAPAALLGVEPVLPLGGLTPAGTVLAAGSCTASAPDAPGSLLPTGAPLLVTFRFTLPPECPAPLPVQARVWVREDHIESALLPVYPDLGDLRFDRCAPGS